MRWGAVAVGAVGIVCLAAESAQAQSLSANDKHKLGQFDAVYRTAMGFLGAASPAKVQEPKETKYYEDKLRQMTQLLDAVTAKRHADYVARRRQLDEYAAMLQQKKAPAAPATGTAPATGAPGTAPTPTGAKGKAQRWAPETVTGRLPLDGLVFATEARASSHYGGGYEPGRATGQPNVWPRLADTSGAWAPRDKRAVEWLEVTFPPTETRWIYIFETHEPGAIKSVTAGDTALYVATEAPSAYTTAQALAIELAAPLTITTLRITVDGSRVNGWAEIDAVGLGRDAPAAAPSGSSPAPSGEHAPALAAFDAAYTRVMQELPDAPPAKVAESRESEFYTRKLKEMRKALEPLAASDDPEVVKRREQLAACDALFRQKRDSVWTQTDRMTLQLVDEKVRAFAAWEGKPFTMEAAAAWVDCRQRLEDSLWVLARNHPEVAETKAKFDAFDAALEVVRQGCRERLAAAGDVAAKLSEYKAAGFEAMPVPADPTPDVMREYGRALKAKLEQAKAAHQLGEDAYLALPGYDQRPDPASQARIDAFNLGQEAKSFVDTGEGPIDRFMAPVKAARGVKPKNITESGLREIVLSEDGSDPMKSLRAGLALAPLWDAYREGRYGLDSQVTELLQGRIEELRQRAAEQLASERFPKGLDRPALRAGAERVLRDMYGDRLLALAVMSDAERSTGTEKRKISETATEILYKVIPYDYDLWTVTYALRSADLPPERCLMYSVRIARSNITNEDHRAGDVYWWGGLSGGCALLVEHLPK